MKIVLNKCMNINEMVNTVSSFSNIDTALDIINKFKLNEKVVLIWHNNKLILK